MDRMWTRGPTHGLGLAEGWRITDSETSAGRRFLRELERIPAPHPHLIKLPCAQGFCAML